MSQIKHKHWNTTLQMMPKPVTNWFMENRSLLALVNTTTKIMAQLALMIGLLFTLSSFSTQPILAASDTTNSAVDTFLIHFTPNSTVAERDAIFAELDVELVNWLAQIHVAEVRVPGKGQVGNEIDQSTSVAASNVAVTESLTRLSNRVANDTAARDLVVTIEANVVVEGVDFPNDPDLLTVDRTYGLSVTHSFEGWEYTEGSTDIIIAILDTGLNLTHPEFAGRVIPGYDFINDDADPSDDNGHGTHTAGIAAAGINNEIGMAGICPACRLMPVKVLNQNNAGTWSGVANGVLYAADHGARVINLSLGAAVSSQTLENAISYAESKGVLVVAAAGNMGVARDFYPAALDNVIAVSATDAQDRHWSLSNYGDYIDVAAPGYAIFSTYHDMNNYYQGYTYMSGTSMASPYVAGLAGLLFSQNQTRGVDEVTHLIVSTADQVGTSDQVAYFGNGRINVARALAVASDSQWTQVVEGEMKDTSGAGTVAGDDNVATVEAGHQLFLPLVTR